MAGDRGRHVGAARAPQRLGREDILADEGGMDGGGEVPPAYEKEWAQCVIVATRCGTTSGGSANEGDR
ncbi:hypothetical protein ACFPM7_29590 [Actinokineospora guangxiensis]|uniref:Uncharacterized protein n=1 Tax=Actinokineospora guangxiensis TaxID=1490288 RepID=A0ABW0EYG6_9PSEU